MISWPIGLEKDKRKKGVLMDDLKNWQTYAILGGFTLE
jgi:hypothetical protein